jgi:peptide chain release factor 2
MSVEETREHFERLQSKIDELSKHLNLEAKVAELRACEEKMAAPDFWSQPESAQRTVKEVSRLKAATQPFTSATAQIEDQGVLLELAEEAGDAGTLREVRGELKRLDSELEALELQALLAGPHDEADCFLSVNAGAGGTESCDWASMLLRMYARWCESQRRKYELIDELDGEEAGLKHATIRIRGPFAYGKLRSELGVHRLVRISPYDAQARRHTSFASVDIVPALDDEIEVDIKESELRIDTYRAGGAGGQHVNKTNSAIRITHLPSGIVVQCQNERSQHQNRRVAMHMLHAKMHQMEEAKRDSELKQSYDSKGQIAWGNQIRSYVLQPYTLVKDHRFGVEAGNANGVLDGDIDRFIEGYLKWKLRGGTG